MPAALYHVKVCETHSRNTLTQIIGKVYERIMAAPIGHKYVLVHTVC